MIFHSICNFCNEIWACALLFGSVPEMDRTVCGRGEDVQFWVCLEVGYGLSGMKLGRQRGLGWYTGCVFWSKPGWSLWVDLGVMVNSKWGRPGRLILLNYPGQECAGSGWVRRLDVT